MTEVEEALRRELLETRRYYQFELKEAQGRAAGLLRWQLQPWLQTALDAAQAVPPRVGVIRERLEDALEAIEQNLQESQR
jgi:hypothetical protein